MDIQAHVAGISAGTGGAKDTEDAKLRRACQDFESVFTAYLLKSMRSTVQKSDLFGSEDKEEVFRDMLDDEIAGAASRQKGIGIADTLYRQLSGVNQAAGSEKPLKAADVSVEKQ
jgi:flagellar protein FlgJ